MLSLTASELGSELTSWVQDFHRYNTSWVLILFEKTTRVMVKIYKTFINFSFSIIQFIFFIIFELLIYW